ncbi:5-formyltetrahydrofolate cyclo-ligase [Aquiflexum balticum DSM 16537]|uniref:5-formyltetrahydrofolate cyclo-ligase n=1 Tax=Aquiflexum balticum DSM 16537 TaxID=758820 RepID=A0A1W2GZ41_9BACT|nr:5-formyltetrahydrofolate cyclo-ligase [Aquiflexum balticum]SMD41881.1 5-formyltetrahydrofolate cyclo-ligase [Aquiflexum balticum DSM 16537]
MDKKTIREQYLLKRRLLTTEEINAQSEIISKRLLDFLSIRPEIRHIHIFLPIKRFNEVNTFPLFERLQGSGYHLYTSEVNKLEDTLDTFEISEVKEFKLNSWGIPFPIGAVKVEPDKIQLVLIPLLAFDKKGYRIGYGKGYYDKFLSKIADSVWKVGLTFFPPENILPAESHDIGLNYCITPEKIHVFE